MSTVRTTESACVTGSRSLTLVAERGATVGGPSDHSPFVPMANLTAWRDLAQSQVRATQAVAAETAQTFRHAKRFPNLPKS